MTHTKAVTVLSLAWLLLLTYFALHPGPVPLAAQTNARWDMDGA